MRFGGLLDTLPDEVVEDLLAVLREALSNVARHARARSSEGEVTAEAVACVWRSVTTVSGR